MRPASPLVLAFAAVLLLAGPARAQTANPERGVLEVLPTKAGADPNQLRLRLVTATGQSRSRLRVTMNPFVVIVTEDGGAALDAGPGCRGAGTGTSPERVICEAPQGSGKVLDTFDIRLGNRADSAVLTGTGPDVDLHAGGGQDTIVATDQPDPSYGLDPTTYPHPVVRLEGGDGPDTLEIAGPRYIAIGNRGDDTLLSTEPGGWIAGRAGEDQLTLRAPGQAYGGDGDDVIRATQVTGDTTLFGGPGKDGIRGGRGADFVVAGTGRDSVLTGAGDDVVKVRDGARDVVNCGGGDDRAVADDAGTDKTVLLCEQEERPAVPG